MRASGTTHHPVQPEPAPDEEQLEENPTQLPIQPEFGPMLPPGEPDDPGFKPPHP